MLFVANITSAFYFSLDRNAQNFIFEVNYEKMYVAPVSALDT